MKSRCAVFLFVLALVITTSAQAQKIGVYGNFDATNYSPVANNSFWTYGPNAGLYYNFFHVGPVSLGGDLRGNYLFSDHYQYRSALIGPRVSFKTPVLPLQPYAQFSFGLGGAKDDGASLAPTGVDSRWTNKFEYMVIGGVDMRLKHHFDLRAVEVGYGRISQGPNFHDSIVTVGSGIVFHF